MRNQYKILQVVMVAILVLFGVFGVFQSLGQSSISELDKITPNEIEKEDNFGETIVLKGDFLFVSAKGDDDLYNYSTTDPTVFENSYNSGAVYIYQRDSTNNVGWTFIQKILPPVDTSNGGYPAYVYEMGKNIAANNDYLILGTPQGGSNSSGEVYIFKYNSTNNQWYFVKSLTATTPQSSGFFGSSITFIGDYLAIKERPLFAVFPTVISIYHKDEGGTENWGKVKEIIHNDLSNEPFWAFSITMTADFLFVSSFQETTISQGSGVVHIYGKDVGGANNWGYVKTITSSDGHNTQQFGYSILAVDTTLIVGATRDNEFGNASGAVYVFYQNESSLNNWGEVRKITSSDIGSSDYFGSSFGLSGDTLLAVSSVDHNQNKGAVYVFHKNRDSINSWDEVGKLEATIGSSNDFFGQTIAIQDSDVVVSAGYDDEIDTDAGAFYTFDISSALVINPPVSTIQTDDFTKDIHIFPNPTGDYCFIRFDTYEANSYPITMQVFDISGRLINEQTIVQNNQRLSLNNMINGVYVVKMIIENKVFIGKIMKQ